MEIRALSRIAVAWLTVTLLALSVPPSPVLASGMAAACRNDSSIAPWDFHLSNFWAFKDAYGANPHKWGIEGSFPALGATAVWISAPALALSICRHRPSGLPSKHIRRLVTASSRLAS